jgi:hypothetical protein
LRALSDAADEASIADALFREYAARSGDDETGVVTWGEAAIALAFAELKLAGACSAEARALALEAIERETDREVAARFGWTLRPARAVALRRMRSVLVDG